MCVVFHGTFPSSWSFLSQLKGLLHPAPVPTPIHPPIHLPSAPFSPLNTSHNVIGALRRVHALLCPAVLSGVVAVAYASRQTRAEWARANQLSGQDECDVEVNVMQKGQSSAFTYNWL